LWGAEVSQGASAQSQQQQQDSLAEQQQFHGSAMQAVHVLLLLLSC
jgi:hypothetical protein